MARSWLSNIFGGGSRAPNPRDVPPPSSRPLAPGERIYAIGDLHGCADLLDVMWRQIRQDLRDHPVERAEIVYLGDYVDRGPDVCGVLDRLASPPADLPSSTVLMGNHELVMLDFLNGQEVGDMWRDLGGFETMRSYGVDPTSIPGRDWATHSRDRLEARMPRTHRALLDALVLSLDRPPYFFCHAGVKPGVPVEDQEPNVLLWIRNDFLRSDADFGRVVVHGHTPVSAPDVRRNRINVDTGAYATGILTCAALEIGAVRLLSAKG